MLGFRRYTAWEWARALPLVHGYKLLRNSAIDRAYRLRPSDDLPAVMQEVHSLKGGVVAATIAFNQPWLIDLMIRSCKKNLVNATLLVADNSQSAAVRREIREICRTHGTPYISLPANPVRHPSRSHGVALNWVYHNVILDIRPRILAFLDHDLFPIRPVDLRVLVRDQPVYGPATSQSWRLSPPNPLAWSVWAGLCIFNFEAVPAEVLDFNTDRSRGLDTGGRNWAKYYRTLDRDSINLVKSQTVSVGDPNTGSTTDAYVVGDFLHVAKGAGMHDESRKRVFIDFVERIERDEAPLVMAVDG